MSTVLQSLNYLAAKNNGFFVSQKQAEFIVTYAKERDGLVGHLLANKNPVFADFDDKGILKMYYSSKTYKGYKDVLIFQRSAKGELNEFQLSEISEIEKKLNRLEKRMSGYINEGRMSGFTYEYLLETIENHKKAIEKIKNK